MTDKITFDLEAAERLADHATPGPWRVTGKDCRFYMSSVFIDREGDPQGVGLVTSDINQDNATLYATDEDLELMAQSRLGVPALCAAVRHQTEYTEELLYALECIHLMATSSGFDMEPHELLDAIDKRAQEARGE